MTPTPLALAALLTLLALSPAEGVAPLQDKSLPERQAAFLKSVQAGKVKEAYAELLAGSLILERAAEVENLIVQTGKGVEIYGGATGTEDLGVIRQHKNVAFGMGVLACEKSPLFFYFVWYRPREDAPWKAQNVWFDDKSKEFFGFKK